MKSMTKVLFVAALLSVLALAACDMTDLEEYNPSGVTDETVFTTPEGFESLVNAAYSYSRWWYGKEEGYAFSEMGTDLWLSGNGDENVPLTSYQDLTGAVDVINGGGVDDITGMWKHLYTAVNLINAGLERIEEAGLSDEMQTLREAELRYLRAFYYWHIVETWGGVHFTLEPTEGIVTTANRTPVEAFYTQIFEDLQFAVENLPVSNSDIGRATKPSAEAFLARMYLTRGRNQEALDLAERVISDYDFELLSDYDALWDMDNLQNSEVIWVVNYTRDLTLSDTEDEILYPNGHFRGGNNVHLFFLSLYDRLPGLDRTIEYGRPFNRFMPTLFLLESYNKEHSTRYEASFQTVWYSNSPDRPEGMALGDTAYWATVQEVPQSFQERVPYTIYDRSEIYQEDGTPVQRGYYPSLTKFVDPTRSSVSLEQSSRDVFVLRLAEMYLLAAEASLNMGDAAQAAEYLNVIRERAARPGHEEEMRVSASEVTRDFLLDEWAREFAGEQIRWFVLKRNDRLIERVRQYNPIAAQYIEEYHRLRPIPQAQLDAVENDDEFTQNPGYQQ